MAFRFGGGATVMLSAAAAVLLAAASVILLDAREVFHALWAYCSRMLVLFRSEMPWRTGLLFIVAGLLGTGAAYAVLGFLADSLKSSLMERRAQRMSVRISKMIFLTSDTSPAAWTAGIIGPRIYLSKDVLQKLGKRESEALLAHERAHVRNHDLLKRVFLHALRRAYFFIPSLSEMIAQIRFGQEVHADRCAMQATSRKAICGLYLSAVHSRKEQASVAAFAFESRRLSAVLEGTVPQLHLSVRKLFLSMLMTVFMIAATIAGLQVREAYASEKHLSCDALASQPPQSFTPLLGPLEFYTPAPVIGVCEEAKSC